MAEADLARIWLHIGHGKTGTTAIQWALHERSRVLGDVIYPVRGRQQGQEAHHNLFPLKGNAYDRRVVDELQAIAAESMDAEKPVVISSEHLCHATPAKVRQIVRNLAGHDLRVVYYVRRQDDLMESSFRQRQCHQPGAWVDPGEYMARFVRGFDFDDRIEPWRQALGDRAIVAHLYHPEIVGRDVVTHFERILGLPEWTDRPAGHRNISLTPAATRQVIQVALAKGGDKARKVAVNLRGADVKGDNSPFYDADARRALIERYRLSNERFARRHLDERSAALLLGIAGAERPAAVPQPVSAATASPA